MGKTVSPFFRGLEAVGANHGKIVTPFTKEVHRRLLPFGEIQAPIYSHSFLLFREKTLISENESCKNDMFFSLGNNNKSDCFRVKGPGNRKLFPKKRALLWKRVQKMLKE